MCGPHFSTLWQQELGQPVTMTEKKITETLNKICSWIDWSPVRVIHFSGGEPLLTKAHQKILGHVPDLSLLELRYQTNGSVFPDQLTIDIWKQVRVLKFEISLDGTGDQYDYIRYPLTWIAVENNINALLELLKNIPATSEIHINCTVNPLNLMYLYSLDTWFAKMKSKYQNFLTLEYDTCNHNAWGLDGITVAHKERFENTHGSDHTAMQLLKNLKLNPTKRQQLQTNLNELDTNRGLNWRQTFANSIALFDD